MNDVNIMLGGSKDNLPDNWKVNTKGNDWIGVDRGAMFLIKNDIVPKIALGDFDSITVEELALVNETVEEVIKVPSEKDITDTELSIITAIEKNKYEHFVIYAATGTRLDHMINSFSIPIQEQFRQHAEKLIFKDKTNTVSYYLPGEHKIIRDKSMSYVAFGAMIPVKNLTLDKGLKYHLVNEDINRPYMYASNEFTADEATFSFDEGLIMVIQTRD